MGFGKVVGRYCVLLESLNVLKLKCIVGVVGIVVLVLCVVVNCFIIGYDWCCFVIGCECLVLFFFVDLYCLIGICICCMFDMKNWLEIDYCMLFRLYFDCWIECENDFDELLVLCFWFGCCVGGMLFGVCVDVFVGIVNELMCVVDSELLWLDDVLFMYFECYFVLFVFVLYWIIGFVYVLLYVFEFDIDVYVMLVDGDSDMG